MKYIVQLLCWIILSGTLITTAIANENTVASSQEGTVISSLDTESFTYIEISKNDQKTWIVASVVAVKPGNHIQFEEGAIMHDFYSKQLNRTFPIVMFVQGVKVTSDK